MNNPPYRVLYFLLFLLKKEKEKKKHSHCYKCVYKGLTQLLNMQHPPPPLPQKKKKRKRKRKREHCHCLAYLFLLNWNLLFVHKLSWVTNGAWLLGWTDFQCKRGQQMYPKYFPNARINWEHASCDSHVHFPTSAYLKWMIPKQFSTSSYPSTARPLFPSERLFVFFTCNPFVPFSRLPLTQSSPSAANGSARGTLARLLASTGPLIPSNQCLGACPSALIPASEPRRAWWQ